MKIDKYLKDLEEQFVLRADPVIAKGQEAYMRNQFSFYGVKTDKRRELQRPFLKKENLPPKEELEGQIRYLWQKPERELQYFAQELIFKYRSDFQVSDISLLEYMITSKSWWDTVDFIASKPIGEYFRKFPEQREECVKRWIASGNIWLQRTAILCQLKNKSKTDTALLESTIISLLGSREFFINKAIGWALREYSKTDPGWVVEFVEDTELSKLSRAEALRLVNSG